MSRVAWSRWLAAAPAPGSRRPIFPRPHFPGLHFPALVALLLLLLAPGVRAAEVHKSTVPSPNRTVVPATLVRVVDGDTAIVKLQRQEIRVRLYGIDAPEKSTPFGPAATKALRSLVEGEDLELEVVTQDSYERLVARIWVGNEDVNAAMIDKGYAWAYRHYLDELPDAPAYCELEADARSARRGVWAAPPAEWEPPWVFRQRERGQAATSRDYSRETAADCRRAIPRRTRSH